jgi:hypothetical protein
MHVGGRLPCSGDHVVRADVDPWGALESRPLGGAHCTCGVADPALLPWGSTSLDVARSRRRTFGGHAPRYARHHFHRNRIPRLSSTLQHHACSGCCRANNQEPDLRQASWAQVHCTHRTPHHPIRRASHRRAKTLRRHGSDASADRPSRWILVVSRVVLRSDDVTAGKKCSRIVTNPLRSHNPSSTETPARSNLRASGTTLRLSPSR